MSAKISSSRWLSVFGAFGLVCAGSLVADVRADGPPGTSPLFYAGTIEDDGALAEGSLPIGVAVFDDADPALPESRLCDIPSANRDVVRGRFRIDVSACVDAVSDNPDVFVEVTVRGVPLPRQKLGAVPYALEAQRSQTAAVAEAVAGGSVDAAALANNSVTGAAIAAAAVGASEIASGAVGSVQIANGAVTAGNIADGVVGSLQLANAGVATADLADAAVTAAKLAPNSVDGSRIVDRSIQGGDILQNSLGGDLLQNGSVERRHAPFALSGAFVDGPPVTSNLVVFATTSILTTQNVALSRHTIPFSGVTFTRAPTCVVVNGDLNTFFGGAMSVVFTSTTAVEIGVREYNGQPVPEQIFRVNTICIGS